jgi:phosphonate transport system ATP-binding protein
MTTPDLLLDVKGLEKAYKPGVPILQGVNTTFRPGEFVVLLGLSGAGKSTYLRCLNRLVTPTTGQILVPRQVIDHHGSGMLDLCQANNSELRLWRRKVGMIFQHFNLVKRLSVLDNVLAGQLGYAGLWKGSLRLFSKAEKDRALYNLERVGLIDQAYQRADTLSGGQQQRVAIARALMQSPALILADEPVASLDPKRSVQILDILHRVAMEDRLTVIVSLHVLELARAYGHRMIGFAGGKVVYDGPTAGMDTAVIARIYDQEGTDDAPSPSRVTARLS